MVIPIQVESVSHLHSNQISNPSQDTGLELDTGYERRSSLTLYIPANIDIDRIIEENPGLNRDKLVYILSLIISIPSRKRDIIDQYYGFTPINAQYLQKRIHDYKRYLTCLIEQGIIEENRQYIVGEKSRSFRFINASPNIIPVTITKYTLIKSITSTKQDYEEALTEKYSFLRKWFNNKLKAQYRRGKNFLEQQLNRDLENPETRNEIVKFQIRLIPFIKLKSRQFSFYVDNSGYRLHTNLTQMFSKLRKFINYDGKKLVSIDIKNSQLYLAIALLDKKVFLNNNIADLITNPSLTSKPNFPIMLVNLIDEIQNKPDVIKFKDWASSGEFYEKFGEILASRGLIERGVDDFRTIVKKKTFFSIYGSNVLISSPFMQAFRDTFPNVYKVFTWIKTGRKNHSALALCLQRLESKLVIDEACVKINQKYPFIPLYTLHDSLITTRENVGFVKAELYNVLKENIGTAPVLKLEWWE